MRSQFLRMTDVELRIVCHHDGPLAELHEFGQDLLNPGRIEHHVILDGRQLLNIIRDRHLRIDRRSKNAP